MLKAYFHLVFSFVVLMVWVGFGILGIASAQAQETSHNEIHKAYESGVNKLLEDAGYSISFEFVRKGVIASGTAAANEALITTPDYELRLNDLPRTRVGGINFYGPEMTTNDKFWREDPFSQTTNVNYHNKPSESFRIYSRDDKSWFPLLFGDYELTLYARDEDCAGWVLIVNGQTLTGIDSLEWGQEYKLPFTVGVSQIVDIEFTYNGCKLALWAGELHRL